MNIDTITDNNVTQIRDAVKKMRTDTPRMHRPPAAETAIISALADYDYIYGRVALADLLSRLAARIANGGVIC